MDKRNYMGKGRTIMMYDLYFSMHRPRMICICDDFRPHKHDQDMDFTRCANCGGWMSDERIVENGYSNEA